MQAIEDVAQFAETIATGTVVAMFHADWCKDCKFIDPFMPDVEKAYQGKIRFVKVDRDRFPELVERYDIFGIPSFVAFFDGKETIRFVSKLRKTREEIEHFLDRVCEVSEALAQN
ncbi:MAG: thiol reductase thioredoxin [Bacillus thermozeamaize]|mgnify:CR=1 FL=1|uniref:Thiol reductase thioredoxin n=1 Tax=Bacillus thermozeamaize TaxID=230954 RepID=A0A1Y3PFW7_9BACI|nr:MAG: thiol reductase thioredoxin [Bacillus thermozeamaize]